MTGIGCLIYRKHKLLNKRLQYFFLRVLILVKKKDVWQTPICFAASAARFFLTLSKL